MVYPLLTEYIEAIKSSQDNLDALKNLRPVLDDRGDPVMSSGNFAVVFKMEDKTSGKYYALKCFLRDQERRSESYRLISDELSQVDSPYLTAIKYIDKELFVDSRTTSDTEFPVLLMDWVEGVNLIDYIKSNINGRLALTFLSYRFSVLAKWLLNQPFAHGDIKPDNILIREDGSIVLVDYDGMYVPAMVGQKARELGSPDFRHPLRDENEFDKHIDDLALCSILLSLKAITVKPFLMNQYGSGDRLLFNENDYRSIHNSPVYNYLEQLIKDENMTQESYDLSQLVELLDKVINERKLTVESFSFLPLSKPTIVGRNSFRRIVESIKIPYGITTIDKDAFAGNVHLKEIVIPDSVIEIRDGAFSGCVALKSVVLPQTIKRIGSRAFYWCKSLERVTMTGNDSKNGSFAVPVAEFGDEVFAYCEALKSVVLPQTIKKIGYETFYGCKSLTNIIIPETVSEIGSFSFKGCISLKDLIIPNNVSAIGMNAFAGCTFLSEIIIPNGVTTIESSLFSGCSSLTKVTIPDSVTVIRDSAFYNCKSLSKQIIPKNVREIGERAFAECDSLKTIIFNNNKGNILLGGPINSSKIKIYIPRGRRDAYANFYNVYEGNELQYRTRDGKDIYKEHEYVDLGLSVKWATCNLGATKPEETGYRSKQIYYSDNDKTLLSSANESRWILDSQKDSNYRLYNHISKLPEPPKYGTPQFVTYVREMETVSSYIDAASRLWGGNWRMPSWSEWEELVKYCKWEETKVKGVEGYKITSNKLGYYDKSIFLPFGELRYWTNQANSTHALIIEFTLGKLSFINNKPVWGKKSIVFNFAVKDGWKFHIRPVFKE